MLAMSLHALHCSTSTSQYLRHNTTQSLNKVPASQPFCVRVTALPSHCITSLKCSHSSPLDSSVTAPLVDPLDSSVTAPLTGRPHCPSPDLNWCRAGKSPGDGRHPLPDAFINTQHLCFWQIPRLTCQSLVWKVRSTHGSRARLARGVRQCRLARFMSTVHSSSPKK